MTSSALSPDDRLTAALAEYQAALDLDLPTERAAFLARFADIPDLAADLDALDALRTAGPTPTAPPAFADFRIDGEAGHGGMGIVYDAWQHSLGRRVALKVLSGAGALDRRARRRFVREAQAAARIVHPNVVPVYCAGEEHGVPFYAMPFVEGPSLADVVHGRAGDALPSAGTADYFAAVARIGVQAADALTAAHALGIVHRDIKPSNLLLDPSGVRVADFGLAALPQSADLTQTGARPGTLRYMSPEQLAGGSKSADPRGDVYSLGATLYELLTRQPAFAADDDAELTRRILIDEPTKPRGVDPRIPFDLETVILKALAKEPAERYASAADLAADLTRFLENRPVLARRPGPVLRLRKWLRRNRRAAVGAGVTLAAGLVLGVAASAARIWVAYGEAERNQALALDALANLSEASDELLSHAPGMQDRQLKYLLRCRDTLVRLDDAALAPAVRREIAWVYYRLGELHTRCGRPAEALPYLDELIRRMEPLAVGDGVAVERLLDLAHAHLQRSVVGAMLDRPELNRTETAAALAYAERAVATRPDMPEAIVVQANLRTQLASLDAQRSGRREPFRVALLAAIGEYERLRDRFPTGHPLSYIRLASAWRAVAVECIDTGRLDEAEAAFRSALGYNDHLRTHFAHEPATVFEASFPCRAELGELLIRRGRVAEGRPLLEDGIAEMERSTRDYPDVRAYSDYFALFLGVLAHAERHAGRSAECRAACERLTTVLNRRPEAISAHYRARLLVQLPCPELRDAEVAGRALTAAGSVVPAWLHALHDLRGGRPAEALARLPAEPDAAGLLVRAACVARLGRGDDARRDLAAAGTLIAAMPLQDLLLLTLQAEVAAIIAAP